MRSTTRGSRSVSTTRTASRRYGSTIELLERVVTWEPGNEEMVVRLGGLAEQAGDHLTAADAWRHLDVLRGGRDAGVKLMLAQALLAAGDGSAALETARRAQELGEDPVLLAPVLARALAASGQLEAAIELVEAQQGWAADPSKLRLIAQLLEAEGRLQEARDRLRAALDVVPSSWTIAHALASLEARTGNLDGARALVERLPNPSDSEADRLLTEAQLTHESGQHELALTLLAGGEQRWPDASALPLTRVYWLMDSDPTAALAASRQAVARAPQDPGLVQQLALLEHRRGELERARSLLADALLANPDDPHLLNDLAYISAEGGDVSDPMLAMARRAVDQRPASGSFLDTLGWILVERGELDEAVVILERAARLAPDDPTISDHLVEARARGAASPPETR